MVSLYSSMVKDKWDKDIIRIRTLYTAIELRIAEHREMWYKSGLDNMTKR